MVAGGADLRDQAIGRLPPVLKINVQPVIQMGRHELGLSSRHCFRRHFRDGLNQRLAVGIQLLNLALA